jgi:predicted RNase H-like nuclease (RuvC/YqgF family)
MSCCFLIDELRISLTEKDEEIRKLSETVEKYKTENNNLKRFCIDNTHTDHKKPTNTTESIEKYKKSIERKDEMISILEYGVEQLEQNIKTQREEYENTIKALRFHIDDLIYKPTTSAIRNYSRSVKK